MKKPILSLLIETLIIFLVVSLFSPLLLSQWSNDPNNNKEVSIQSNRTDLKTISDSKGGIIICSRVYNSPNSSSLFVQRLNTDGFEKWGDGGKQVSDSGTVYGGSDEFDIISDLNGGAYIAWEDYRESSWISLLKNIYIQHIDSEGISTWQDGGISICHLKSNIDFSIKLDKNGNVLVLWNLFSPPNPGTYGQILDKNGNKLWGVNGKKLFANNELSNRNALITSSNSILIINNDSLYNLSINGDEIWRSKIYGRFDYEMWEYNNEYYVKWRTWDELYNQDSLYIKKYSNDGNILFRKYIGSGVYTTLRFDIYGNIYLLVGYKPSYKYLNKVDKNGNVLWHNDVIVTDSLNGFESFILNNNGEPIITWKKSSKNNIYIQKYSINGEIQLGKNTSISNAPPDYFMTSLAGPIKSSGDSFIYSWIIYKNQTYIVQATKFIDIENEDKTPIIFIPGIMGSPLYQDNNNDNHLSDNEKAWVPFNLPSLGNLDYLLLKPNGIDPSLDKADIKVSPLRNDPPINLVEELNHKPMDVYKGFFNNLENSGYVIDNYNNNHSEGENLFCFTYDWRKDNTLNAQLLSKFIDSVRNWTGSTNVDIIAHSMGGFVSKKCISTSDKSRIDKIIFIGTPHLGSPEAVTVLLTGELDKWYDLITEDFVKTLAKNLLSCYQLAPSINYFDPNIKNNISSNIESYSHCFLLSNDFFSNGKYTTYEQMNEYLDDHLNQFLNNESESFRESIANIDFGNIKVFNIVGYNLPTIGQNSVGPSIIPFKPTICIPSRILNGDETVPLKSAEIINNKVFENTFYIPNVVHRDLASSSQAIEVILGVLKNSTIKDFPQYSKPPQSYAAPNHIHAQVACPIALDAYDSVGRHTGPLTDSTWEANIPGSIYIPGNLNDSTSSKTILLPNGNKYRLEMKSLNKNGLFDFFLQDVKNGNINKFLVYNSIPFQPNTTVSCSLNTVFFLPTLEVDLNNNGTIDTVIVPQDLTVNTENNKSENPKAFLLSQNYPNPFNPTTNINYSIPHATNVTIKVFNILGQEIKTIVNEYQNADRYTISIDLGSYASGVYIYQMRAGEFMAAKKIILLK